MKLRQHLPKTDAPWYLQEAIAEKRKTPKMLIYLLAASRMGNGRNRLRLESMIHIHGMLALLFPRMAELFILLLTEREAREELIYIKPLWMLMAIGDG